MMSIGVASESKTMSEALAAGKIEHTLIIKDEKLDDMIAIIDRAILPSQTSDAEGNAEGSLNVLEESISLTVSL